MENELASVEGNFSTKRREWKVEGEKLRDDLSLMHRKVLSEAEQTRTLKETISRLEKEHSIKMEKSEDR